MNAGIRPVEFWAMTPREVSLVVDGHHHCRNELGYMLAHFVAFNLDEKYRKKANLWPPEKSGVSENRTSKRRKSEPVFTPEELERHRRGVNAFMAGRRGHRRAAR